MIIGSTLSQKVTARHLQRQAMLYVRQSTLHQVLENTESTARQYALLSEQSGLDGPPSALWSLTRTWVNQELAPSIGRDFSAW